MVNSKQKGNQFENKIYKELKSYDAFIRKAPGSGSMKGECADIILRDYYAIECKHYKVVEWSNIRVWWNKVKIDIMNAKKNYQPVIIIKENRKPTLVACKMELEKKTVMGLIPYSVWKKIIFPYGKQNE